MRSSSSGGLHITTSRWPRAGAVAVDEVELEAGQLLRERERVGDRGGGEHEPRPGPVGLGEPPQPAQHVRDVRAEHAPVDVRLVDDHEREVREEVAPGGVVRQDADVQHVRVGEHHVRARRIAARSSCGVSPS